MPDEGWEQLCLFSLFSYRVARQLAPKEMVPWRTLQSQAILSAALE